MMRPFASTTIVLFAFGQVSAAIITTHFIEWYPAYAPDFKRFARDNCNDQIADYLAGHSDGCPSQGWPQCLSGRVIDCLLDNSHEFNKANMAAAGVVLGLLPTILSLAGSSTTENGLLAMKRPLLALLLSAGGPVVSPIRSFVFINPATAREGKEASLGIEKLLVKHWPARILLSSAEYLLATAAVVNLMHAGWELGVKAVCSFSTDTTYHPLLWSVMAVAIHLAGAVAMRLRLRLELVTPQSRKRAPWRLVRQEFQVCLLGPRVKLLLLERSLFFTLFSWITSIGTLVHVIYGTLVLSSTLFVATADALTIASRYLASTLVCRALVVFEVAGIKSRLVGREDPLEEHENTD